MAARGGSSMFANPYLHLYAFGSFSNGLFISLRGPILPELAKRIGCESAALGAFLGLGGVSGGVFSVPTGLMLDRADPHSVRTQGREQERAGRDASPPWHGPLIFIIVEQQNSALTETASPNRTAYAAPVSFQVQSSCRLKLGCVTCARRRSELPTPRCSWRG